jgi:prepilin-type processing-associated H-X9-DG protein/prepilin-type N-terminal cleavage/methylation domain-containing protein
MRASVVQQNCELERRCGTGYAQPDISAATRPVFRKPPRAASGLTLIEVLVVTAVLGILAGLLLPSLAQAKGKVRRLDCFNRLKQWNVAFRSFADDSDGWIARECYEPLGEVTINNWSQVKGRPQPDGTTDSQDVWYNALPAHLNQTPTIRFAAPPDRRDFFDTRHLIHCPSGRFPGYAFRPTYQFPLFSLAMNSQLIRSGPTIQFSALEQRDPARTVTFLDNLLEGEAKVHAAQESTHLGQPGAYANRFGARHQQGGNLAFADGHVAWFHGREVVETQEGSPLLGGPILPPKDIVWEIYPY